MYLKFTIINDIIVPAPWLAQQIHGGMPGGIPTRLPHPCPIHNPGQPGHVPPHSQAPQPGQIPQLGQFPMPGQIHPIPMPGQIPPPDQVRHPQPGMVPGPVPGPVPQPNLQVPSQLIQASNHIQPKNNGLPPQQGIVM